MRVRNYDISNDGVLLYISHKGKQYYTEYTQELEALFSSGELGSFSTNGKRGGYYPKFDLGPYRRKSTPYLHHIAYCAQFCGLNRDNYAEVLSEFSSHLKEMNSCVDHLHSDVKNCCVSNLHKMTVKDHYKKTAAEHRSRLRIMSKKATFFHVVKANDGKYIRVQIAYTSSSIHKRIRLVRLYCTTDDAFIDLLTHINMSKIWDIVNERRGTVCSDNSYILSGGFLASPKLIPQKPIYVLQQDLLKMDLTEFSLWEKNH